MLLVCLILLGILPLYAQEIPADPEVERPERVALTVGILQGGGSLIGADLEFLISKSVGFQLGAGFRGYGAGVNFHFQPTIRSSFVSLAYWHQGIGESHSQTVMGPTFVYRSKKWFTAQLGLGAPLERGPAWPSEIDQPPVILMYSIGAYFPL